MHRSTQTQPAIDAATSSVDSTAHGRDQALELDGFGDEVVAAGGLRAFDVGRVARGGERDHDHRGAARVGGETADEVEALHAGELEVGEDHARREPGELVERVLGVDRGVDLEAGIREDDARELATRRIVLDDQHTTNSHYQNSIDHPGGVDHVLRGSEHAWRIQLDLLVYRAKRILMRAVLLCLALMFVPSGSDAAPDQTDMGGWDCSGSKPKEVTVEPGEHVFAWHGSCSGAEGWDVIVEPKPKDITTRMTFDAKAKVLQLRVINKGAARKVKLHVFVGFA
jgi:hypothetical protein